MPPSTGRSSKPAPRTRAPSEPPALTKREYEVVEWIAAGKRNREIGEILQCSSRTVQKHVQHILEKLYVETRTAVCVWWYEHPQHRKNRVNGRRKGVAD